MSFVPLQDNTPNSINKALEELHGLITTVRQVVEKKEVTPVTEVIPTAVTSTTTAPLAELPTLFLHQQGQMKTPSMLLMPMWSFHGTI